jgi:hypothetical protein
VSRPGPYYPLGIIGTVPRAYKEMKWKKNTNKEMKKIRKCNTK